MTCGVIPDVRSLASCLLFWRADACTGHGVNYIDGYASDITDWNLSALASCIVPHVRSSASSLLFWRADAGASDGIDYVDSDAGNITNRFLALASSFIPDIRSETRLSLFGRADAGTGLEVDHFESDASNFARFNFDVLALAGCLIEKLSELADFWYSGRALALAFVRIEFLRVFASQLANGDHLDASTGEAIPSLTIWARGKRHTCPNAFAGFLVLLRVERAFSFDAFAATGSLVKEFSRWASNT